MRRDGSGELIHRDIADPVVKGANTIARIGVDGGRVIDDDISVDLSQREQRRDNSVGSRA